MRVKLRFQIGAAPRHPLFPRVAAARVWRARGPCAALAGTFAELKEAAKAGARPSRAVFPLYCGPVHILGSAERDELWHLFQVPVLGLLLDPMGRVAAYECEAQDGLHIMSSAANTAGTVISSACACGRPGDRLMPALRIPPKRCSQMAFEFAGAARRVTA